MNYPKNIVGTYTCNFNSLTLKPISIPKPDAAEFLVEQICFNDGLAHVIFEDSSVKLLPVRYDEQNNWYLIDYRGDQVVQHMFQVKASLAGLSKVVQIKLFIDFKKV